MHRFSAQLREGMNVHVRHNSRLGRMIRWALNKWLKRICEDLGVPVVQVWGNHDGITVKVNGRMFIGEATPRGNILTPVEDYERLLDLGKIEVRIYEVIGATLADGKNAAMFWILNVKGRPYNFMAYPRLLCKSLFFDLSYSKIKWLKKIGDKAAGWEWADWCTEGFQKAWVRIKDVLQTGNPTPLTVEQVANEVPRRISKLTMLRQVTESYLFNTEIKGV